LAAVGVRCARGAAPVQRAVGRLWADATEGFAARSIRKVRRHDDMGGGGWGTLAAVERACRAARVRGARARELWHKEKCVGSGQQ
jgi:hypothetical protein